MNEDTQKYPNPSRTMTVHDLALWGVEDVAYIKHVTNEEAGWAIYGADGTKIGLAQERDLAFAAVRQHDLEPVSVH